MTIAIAGQRIADPLAVLNNYARNNASALRKFDGARSADPYVLVEADVLVTRALHSRISNAQINEVVDRSSKFEHLWRAIPVNADLADADPEVRGGLYDVADELFRGLRGDGVGDSKVSKIVHLKRRSLFPILDSRVKKLYDEPAKAAAKALGSPHSHRYWATIREDVIRNREELDSIRSGGSMAKELSSLSDLRLLDILSWKLAG